MKKMLGWLGVFSISATLINTGIMTFNQNQNSFKNINQNKTTQSLTSSSAINDDAIKQMQFAYENLSEITKNQVSEEMKIISELNLNELQSFLVSSKTSFIQENQVMIAKMLGIYQKAKMLQQPSQITTYALEIPWSQINNLIDLGLTDSNQYDPWTDTYGPSNWWKIWEWGWQIHFPEGDINVMRVVNFFFTYYDGLNFSGFEKDLNIIKNVLDYLINLDEHGQDKVEVLYNLIIETKEKMLASRIPFTQELFKILDTLSSILNLLKKLSISSISGIIKNQVQEKLGMSLEELGTNYSKYLNLAFALQPMVNTVLDIFRTILPTEVVNYLINGLQTVAKEMVNADKNKIGVVLRFQQFLIPIGFSPR